MVDAVEVGAALGVGHQLAEPVDRQHALLALGRHGPLEEEPAVDVDHDLGRAGQVAVEDGQLGAGVVARRCQPGLHHDRLAEDAGGLGQRHRRLALQRRAVGQVGVVVGVAQLVGQGLHAVEAAVEVEQHPADLALHRHAERPAHLARPGLGVEPAIRRPQCATTSARRGEKLAKAVGHRPGRLVPREPLGLCRPARAGPTTAGPDGVAEQRRLGPVVAGEVGQGGDHRLLHGVERRAVDVVVEQRHVERVGPAPPTVQGVGLALERVEGRGQRDRHRLPRRQLGVEGRPAHGRVGVGGQAPHRAHGQDPRLVLTGEGDRRRVSRAVTSPCSFDHARPPVSASSAARSSSASPIWCSAAAAARRRAKAWSAATGLRLDQGGGADRGDPGGEPLVQSGHRGRVGLEPGLQVGGEVRLGAGGHVGVEVGADQPHLLGQLVDAGQDLLDHRDVVVGRVSGLAAPHAVGVERSGQPSHRRLDRLLGEGELPALQAREQRVRVPAGELVGGGHRPIFADRCPSDLLTRPCRVPLGVATVGP